MAMALALKKRLQTKLKKKSQVVERKKKIEKKKVGGGKELRKKYEREKMSKCEEN